MNELLVASTIVGNVAVVLLLLYQGWAGRLQWFTLMTAFAVLVDCLFYFIHGFDHKLYAPLRIFVQYWTFPILECVCAWEAWRAGVKWLEYLMLIQVGLAVIGCAAHLHGDPWAVYRFEMFVIYVNLAGILLCMLKFRKECTYGSR